MTTLVALLRQNRNYRYTSMGQVVSEIADYFNNIAVLALVMEKSGSGLVVSGVMLSRAIPAVLAGPVAGVLLDRLDRRTWRRTFWGAWRRGICSITGGGQVGFHEEPRSMVSARCWIRSAREGIFITPLTRSRMY